MRGFLGKIAVCALMLAGMSASAMPLGIRTMMHGRAAVRQTVPLPEPSPTPEPTPEPVSAPELYEADEGAAPATVSVYDGYLYDKEGSVVGTIQVKVGRPNKDGLAVVRATVIGLDGKKKNLKAAEKGKAQIAADGPTVVAFAGGEACTVTLGADGLAGSYGVYGIDGARNLFTSKDKAEQNAANGLQAQLPGAVNVAWDGGALTVTIAKKGKAKVAGTLANGAKVSAKGQLLVGEEWCAVPVAWSKKQDTLAFVLWLSRTGGRLVVEGLGTSAVAGRPGTLKGGAKFRLDAKAFAAAWGQEALPYLPDGLSVASANGKWAVAGGAKAGKVQYGKDGTVDVTKLGENPSALKLTYKAKDGSFKGSFKAYALVKGKPKATTVNVAGVLVEGVGYGTASVKKPAFSVPVTIE